jgi:hypothetical protein
VSEQALEPTLTKHDLRVLSALPPCVEEELTPERAKAEREAALTPWQLGEVLGELDVASLRLQLRGLNQLDYVWCSERDRREIFWRTRKGNRAVA